MHCHDRSAEGGGMQIVPAASRSILNCLQSSMHALRFIGSMGPHAATAPTTVTVASLEQPIAVHPLVEQLVSGATAATSASAASAEILFMSRLLSTPYARMRPFY